MSKQERVILCSTCGGKGTEYNQSVSKNLKCLRCKGSGRLVRTTIVTEKPYKK